ncbi:hypothetical protein BIW11_14136 [Tropilaelaps mercedesae]|uniref:Uncharacterized protein n=1 Tax=Tropilaelaps mercedesae TaxID=418985 RepID=A0A1V9WZ36_9ACAR|nr:hypothetical protein BIW11_14136 [Tropilaelaps mercedesae]
MFYSNSNTADGPRRCNRWDGKK